MTCFLFSVQWQDYFDCEVEYEEGIPDEPEYWQNIKKGAIFIFDDLWAEASESLQVSKAFKIWSKKHFSIIIEPRLVVNINISLIILLELFRAR